ncbi:GTPase Obg [Smittium culicis]|uniref:GTPase Obg n=1 Tax=Smittium culicis TaxID=133412 RepID=A0A1R1X4G3_9FUNG|nr:GTPase Obg [Smittium culicis]OMJ26082.1 GTPase Obg [Smittium culicis]
MNTLFKNKKIFREIGFVTYGRLYTQINSHSNAADIQNPESETKITNSSRGGNFIDYRRIAVHGGSGGSGCVCFQRERHLPRGPPNGGNGGAGGNVIFVADINESSLYSIPTKVSAQSGTRGKGKDMNGIRGKDTIVRVPVGTIVREIAPPNYEFLTGYDSNSFFSNKKSKDKRSNIKNRTKSEISSEGKESLTENENSDNYFGESKKKPFESALEKLHYEIESERKEVLKITSLYNFYPSKVIRDESTDIQNLPEEYLSYLHELSNQTPIQFDFDEDKQSLIVARGGFGGYGNPHFASSTNRSPYMALNGLPGQMRFLELELKTIADVGLVGLPNVGKSTFISAVSNASPRIANYPFTTLNPYIGTITLDNYKKLTIADIPGIIKDAHLNKGLGLSFLRHIERSNILAYVVDLSLPDPWTQLYTLRSELEFYKKDLTKKPSIVIANKADLSLTSKPNYQRWLEFSDIPIIPVSSKNVKNVSKVIHTLANLLEANKKN